MGTRKDDKRSRGWSPSTFRALSSVCRKRWRTLDLAVGSPSPPMRINCASALLGGELYVFGGLNAGPSKSMWVLNVRQRRWRAVPTRNGVAPPPRQGHTMCWDGRTSLWVFGGQGADTWSADSSRTHQGVKIRTLARRTCFNDFFEFDTQRLEWVDHVQAGVCPTSRRGHTATLVLGRRRLRSTKQPMGDASSLDGSETPDPFGQANNIADGSASEALGDGRGKSRNENHLGSESNTGASRDEKVLERAGDHPELDEAMGSPPRCGEHGIADDRKEGGRSRARRPGLGQGGSGAGDHAADRPASECISREMFVIGGAGTDPIRNMEVVHPQLWIFDFDAKSWSCVEAKEGKGRRGNKSGSAGDSCGGAGPGPPAVFDHTATLLGQNHIMVVGGVMVGTALNTDVRTLNTRNSMWSIAVCDAVRRPSTDITGEGNDKDGESRAVRQVSGRLDEEPSQTRACLDGGKPDSRERGGSLMKSSPPPMLHQRNGHTCFVWDTSQVAQAGGSESTKKASPSNGQASGKEGRNRTAKGQENPRSGGHGEKSTGSRSESSPKRSKSDQGKKNREKNARRGKVPEGAERSPKQAEDDPLPSRCIVTFGGSALRSGGGYAEADLYVLEDIPYGGFKAEEKDGGENSAEGDVEGEERGEWEGKTSDGQRRATHHGLSVGFDRVEDVTVRPRKEMTAREKSLSMFQACTESVMMQLHSLHSMGKQHLNFGDMRQDDDLSYLEAKVRSVILGEGGSGGGNQALSSRDGKRGHAACPANAISGGRETSGTQKAAGRSEATRECIIVVVAVEKRIVSTLRSSGRDISIVYSIINDNRALFTATY